VRCPRCSRETKEGAQFCPGCGAPLTLRPEPTPRAIDLSLTLDRRTLRQPGRKAPPAADGEPPPLEPLPEVAGFARDDPDDFITGLDLERSVDDLDPADIVGRTLPSAPPRSVPPPPARPPPPPPPPPRPASRPGAAARPPPGAARPLPPLHETLKPAAPQRPLELPQADADRSHYDLGKLFEAPEPEPAWASEAFEARSAVPPAPVRSTPPAALPAGPVVAPAPAARPAPAPLAAPLSRPAPPAPAQPAPAPAAARVSPPPPRAAAPVPPVPPDEAGTVEVVIAPMEVHLRRAASWRRLLAWAIDGLPFLAMYAIALRAALESLPHPGPLDLTGLAEQALTEATGVTLPLLGGVAILFGVYQALAHGLGGATLGKRLSGLRLVGPGGGRPGLGRSAVRAVLLVPSAGLLGLGVLLPLFTRSGRSLHDLLARTWVVRAP